ncbi:MAG TPA: hypothetical protein V6C97_13725 [Oculatellaceae cyanobacterium]
MYQAAVMERSQSVTSQFNRTANVCFFSAALFMVSEFAHAVGMLLVRALWSNEGKTVLGSSMFYPTIALTVLYVVAQLVPNRVVTYCAGYCKRKALSIWFRVRRMLASQLSLMSRLVASKSRLLASVRIMVGTIELFCL